MKVQKIQSNNKTFGTTVVLTQELNNMLKKRGYGISLRFKDDIHWLENNGNDDTMTVFLKIAKNRRNYVRAVLSKIDELGRIFVSKDLTEKPFLKNKRIARLQEMYYELEQSPLREVK